MLKHYSDEVNVQMLIVLLKKHNIRYIVASPGATNVSFVASCQQDSFFKMYSCVDERSAAYMACGITSETGEPVVLTCTGATASRNYLSALTEAYYRKLPILAVTSSRPNGWIGNDIQQVTDRRNPPSDTALISTQIPIIHDEDEKWAYSVKMNEALLELRHRGGGPVHINLQTTYSSDFSVEELPNFKSIFRIEEDDEFPQIPRGKIGIFVGSHKVWSSALTAVVDRFCEIYDAVVLCDQTSNYRGNYRVLSTMVCSQRREESGLKKFDLIIHLGDITGAMFGFEVDNIWRVNPDGLVKDPFRKLSMVFEMSEGSFFSHYVSIADASKICLSQYEQWGEVNRRLYNLLPELPFSNLWIAQQIIPLLPKNSELHLGIYNTLRSWDFFDTDKTVNCYCNTGGFGIDGNISTLVGASLINPDKLYFGVVGDLSFFYDMNILGNRHIGSNIRIIVINNGIGVEFKQHINRAAQFEEDTDVYIAAEGHNGRKSKSLLKHYSEDLGFKYLTASNKEEFNLVKGEFISSQMTEKPIVLELFTNADDEDKALLLARTVDSQMYECNQNGVARKMVKKILGSKGTEAVKSIFKK